MFPENEPKDRFFHKKRVPWHIVRARIADGQYTVIERFKPSISIKEEELTKWEICGRPSSKRISAEVAASIAKLETRMRFTQKRCPDRKPKKS